jgi:hypothetical protein
MPRCATCGLEIETPDGTCGNCVHQSEPPTASGPPSPDTGEATASEVAVGALAVVPASTGSRALRAQHLLAIGAASVLGLVVAITLLSTRSAAREEHPAHDRAAPRPPASLAPSPVPREMPAVAPVWSNANQARWVSNHPKSVAFELPAEHDVPVWMGRVHPLLVVRCLSHKADAFVFIDSPAGIEPEDENHTVHVAFDDDAESTERWLDSEEHDALFAPDGGAFARRLAHARTLQFAFTPQNAPAVTVRFNTKGFDALFDDIAAKCRM